MSVLDRGYRRWRGTPTPYLQRVLVIPKYDLREIRDRKTWLMSYVACLVPPLALAVAAYVTTNAAIISSYLPMIQGLSDQITPGPRAYEMVTWVQIWLCLGFTLLVGPPLATRDFANSAIPLYLSKALRRFDYVAGRWAVLAGLLSLATWIPLLLVLGLQAGMSKPAWRADNAWLAGAVLVTAVPIVVVLTGLVTAMAAWVHRANHARAALIALFFVTWFFSFPLRNATGSELALVVSPLQVTRTINSWAFEPPSHEDPRREELLRQRGRAPQRVPDSSLPVPIAFLALAAWVGAAVAVLAWRVRPVEVVK
jgi:ABC-2 type transport system permease protein